MSIKNHLNLSQKFIKKYQKKLNDIKKHIEDLKAEEQTLEKKPPLFEGEENKKVENEVLINISFLSVIKATIGILLVLGLAQILGIIRNTIILFLVALFLSATLNRPVDFLESKKVPRGLGVLGMFILLIGLLVLIFSLLGPLIAEQVVTLAASISSMAQNVFTGQVDDSWIAYRLQPILEQIWEGLDQRELMGTLTETLKNVGSTLTEFAGRGVSAIFSIFNGILNFLLVMIITFFMTVRGHASSDFFQSLFPKKYSSYISAKVKEINIRIGEWVRGQFLLAMTMGVLAYIVFSIIGLPYALTIAMIAALAEFIPYLGPIVTFSVAALIAVNESPLTLLWVMIAYMVMQVLENNILAPLIMGKSVGLSPVIILFSAFSGWAIGREVGGSVGMGLVGMIVAVPTANIISIFVEDYTQRNK